MVSAFSRPDSCSIRGVDRSLLAILTDRSVQIDIPADTESGATQPAVHLAGGEAHPVLQC